MWTSADEYLETQRQEEKRKEKDVRERLLDIYQNGNDDIKQIISMLIHTEYRLAIENDNYSRLYNNYNTLQLNTDNVEKYKKENQDLIEKVW